jgi:hypothetical protein
VEEEQLNEPTEPTQMQIDRRRIKALEEALRVVQETSLEHAGKQNQRIAVLEAELTQAQVRVIELSNMKPATMRQRIQWLEAGLRDAATRLRACAISGGTDPKYADLAVAAYFQLLEERQ